MKKVYIVWLIYGNERRLSAVFDNQKAAVEYANRGEVNTVKTDITMEVVFSDASEI